MDTSLFSLSDSEHKSALFTPWSLVHVWSSITLYLLFNIYVSNKLSLILTLIIHTLYEYRDFTSTYNIKLSMESSHNSLFNSVGDTICCILGIFIIMWMDIKGTKNKVLFLLIFYLINSLMIQILIFNNMELNSE